jgi:hypothetical protein
MMLTLSERRKAFRAALLLADYESVEKWAKERGYNGNHVHLVLRGQRPSVRLQVMVDAFAIETLLAYADTLREALSNPNRVQEVAA